jgi:biotin synthase
LNPAIEIRIAGGREMHLRSLQSLGLFVANSLFIGDYLTTRGQASQLDRDMVRDLGFEIVGETSPLSAPAAPEVEMVTRQSRQ